MKKYLLIGFIALVGFYSCKQTESTKKHSIKVQGHIKFADANDKFGITLNKRNDKNEFEVVKKIDLDTENNYSFELTTETPEFYTLDVYKQQRVEFYADDENLTINFRGIDTAKIKIKNPPHVHIKGGIKNNVLNAVHFAIYQNYQEMIAIGKQQYKSSKSDCEEWKNFSQTLWNDMDTSFERDIKNIVEMYNDYPTVIKALQSLSWKRHKEYMFEQYNLLSDKFKDVPYVQKASAELLKRIENISKTDIGKVAPNFTLPDINGKEVSLSDFRGKYVLIDFWASWCGPCRLESPNVKKQYELYKDKGFEVVSVSIDKKPKAWKKAVKEDKLKGTILIAQDSKKIQMEYSFSGIPYMVLLDKEGKVIAKNVRGETLQKKLKEIFN